MADLRETAARLQEKIEGLVELNRVLAPFTSYGIGGPTALWVEPGTVEDVGRALALIHDAEIPLLVLGGGTNMLIADDGWPGATLFLGRNISGWTFAETEATAYAGNTLLDFIHEAVRRGLAGMESMAGIPGCIGGAVRMNAGAFGQEIGGCVTEVRGFKPDGAPFVLKRDELLFGYRRTEGLGDGIITEVKFRFADSDKKALQGRVVEVLTMRREKQPLDFPSCGSVFKRPEGHFAGELIERAGLKGRRIGGAMVSAKHAGFIVNTGGATAGDVLELIRIIENEVLKRFGVKLEREVKTVGLKE